MSDVSSCNSVDNLPVAQKRRKDENEDTIEIAPLNQEYHDNRGKFMCVALVVI